MSAIGDLLRLWGIPVAVEARRASRGTNNTTFTVRHNDRCWVLRVSQNLSAPQVAAEHRLLERLRRAGLPFAVPEPVAALDGRTVVETGEGPATVCRLLYSSGVLDWPDWEHRAAALIAGFGSCVHLREPEIQVLPAMILWRSVGSVLWRAGRWRRGLDQTALIAERIENLARTTDWLDHHGRALIALGLTSAGG